MKFETAQSIDNLNGHEIYAPSSFEDEQTIRLIFFCEGEPSSDEDSAGCGAVITSENARLWEIGETILYAFCDGDHVQRAKFEKTVAEWQLYANLTFEPRDIKDESHIRITFRTGKNLCKVGKLYPETSSKETMHLGFIRSKPEEASRAEQGLILHEWGHVLGLFHEHQSPFFHRDLGFTWDREETRGHFYQKYTHGLSTDATLEWMKNNVYRVEKSTNYTRYDPKSIMTYEIPQACYRTDPWRKDFLMVANACLSECDKAFVAIQYPKPSNILLQQHLRTLGIPPAVSEGWDHTNVRQEFWRYQKQRINPKLLILLEGPFVSDATEHYEISVETDIWGITPLGQVTKKYSEIVTLHSALKKQAKGINWCVSDLPQPNEDTSSVDKTIKLDEFVKFVPRIIGLQDEIFRDEVRRFFQDARSPQEPR